MSDDRSGVGPTDDCSVCGNSFRMMNHSMCIVDKFYGNEPGAPASPSPVAPVAAAPPGSPEFRDKVADAVLSSSVQRNLDDAVMACDRAVESINVALRNISAMAGQPAPHSYGRLPGSAPDSCFGGRANPFENSVSVPALPTTDTLSGSRFGTFPAVACRCSYYSSHDRADSFTRQ